MKRRDWHLTNRFAWLRPRKPRLAATGIVAAAASVAAVIVTLQGAVLSGGWLGGICAGLLLGQLIRSIGTGRPP